MTLQALALADPDDGASNCNELGIVKGWLDPAQSSFHDVRVLAIPTPRRTAYDTACFGVPLPDTVPATVQDRG